MASGKPHDFIRYHKLPEKLIPINIECNDKHNKFHKGKREKSMFLQKEDWEPYHVT
jgi:hypothetical protein